MKPYTEQKTGNIIRRTFSHLVESEELVWHRDSEDRIVIPLNENDWLVQFDNELPKKLNINEEFFIPKNTFHRVIKGSVDLMVEIIETKFEDDELVVYEAIEEGKKKKGKKDACYHKVRARYDVWPSAYACVPENTSKALTRDGWRDVNQLSIGDEIMTYNIEKDELEFKPILNLHRYKDVKTNVVRSGNNGFVFEATDNHKWVVKLPDIKGNRLQKYNRINDKALIETSDLLTNKSNKSLVVSAPYNGGNNVKLDEIFKYGTNWVKYILDITNEQRQAWLFSAIVYDGNQQRVQRLTENTNNIDGLNWLYTGPHGKQSFGFKQKDIDHRDAFLLSAFLNSGLVTWKKAKDKDIYSCHYTSNKPLKNTSNFKILKENISDVWCPETENGTWVMMQETEGHGIITITGNSGALVKCRKVGAANWGNKTNESEEGNFEQILNKIKGYKLFSIKEFNKKMAEEWIPMWKTEYENDVAKINELVARNFLYELAQELVGGVQEIDFRNEGKNPVNHFQMEMYLGNIILQTAPFIYVDNNHKVVSKRTQIEILNNDYDTIKKLMEVGEEPIEEKWSEKYKRSIDCSNPKGFSQRAHCQGRKKRNESIEDREKYSKEMIKKAHDAITRRKGKDYAPDVHELQAWIDNYLKINNIELDEAKKTDFSKEKEQGLHGWFARKGGEGKSQGWVDCNTCRKDPETGRKKCKSCGRKEGEKRAKYPACRPTPSACGTPKKGKSWGKKSNENLSMSENLSIFESKNIIKNMLRETFGQDDTMAEPMTQPAPVKPKTAPVEPVKQPNRKDKPFLPMPNVQPDPKAIKEGKFDYETYHKTLSSALDAARNYSVVRGYDEVEFNMNDVQHVPYGHTERFSKELTKSGIPQRKALQVQIYRMESGNYELNMYIN